MFKVILSSGYEDFLVRESELRNSFIKHGNSKCNIYYRGHGNYIWQLTPTLFRSYNHKHLNHSMVTYFEELWEYGKRVDPDIYRPSLSESEFCELLHEIRKCDSILRPKQKVLVEYLIRARHFKYPSPLLDWTRNLHVATYFAYSEVKNESSPIAIYMAFRSNRDPTDNHGNGNEVAFLFEDPVDSQVDRHNKQEAMYSVSYCNSSCLNRFVFKELTDEYAMFNQSPFNLKIYKFIIPSDETEAMLSQLDVKHKINEETLGLTN